MDSMFAQVHRELEEQIQRGIRDGSIVNVDSKATAQVIISPDGGCQPYPRADPPMPCRSSMTRRWTSSPAPSAKTSLPFLRKINRSGSVLPGIFDGLCSSTYFLQENPFSCRVAHPAAVPERHVCLRVRARPCPASDALPPRIPSAPPCASVIQKGLPLSGQALARSCAGLGA